VPSRRAIIVALLITKITRDYSVYFATKATDFIASYVCIHLQIAVILVAFDFEMFQALRKAINRRAENGRLSQRETRFTDFYVRLENIVVYRRLQYITILRHNILHTGLTKCN